jgi:steroid 5-alpha reductase family enzyme
MNLKRIVIYLLIFVITIAVATQGFTELNLDGLLLVFLITWGYFTVIFVVAQIMKNNSIVDLGWGPGFVIGSWVSLILREQPTVLSYIITIFITIWGLRLGIRITKRNWGKPEDFRYANWRKEWGKNVVIIAFFRVFMIQAIINFIVGSASYTIILYNQFDFNNFSQLIVYLGLVVALIGLFFEVVGDEQLRRHIQKGTRSLMKDGLWSMTRHPNYFGEIMIWVGLYVSGLVLLADSSVPIVFYLALVISPIIMSTVLIKISTPLLEKNMEKYDGWEKYCENTPMIFPVKKLW